MKYPEVTAAPAPVLFSAFKNIVPTRSLLLAATIVAFEAAVTAEAAYVAISAVVECVISVVMYAFEFAVLNVAAAPQVITTVCVPVSELPATVIV